MSAGRKSERGQVLVMFAMLGIVLLGGVALVMDVGQMYMARRQLQNVADLAALAGARNMDSDPVQAAYDYAVKNGINPVTGAANHTCLPNAGDCNLLIDWPPTAGHHANDTDYVEVQAQRNVATIFAFVFGRNSMPVSARAVARRTTDFGDAALIALSDRCNPIPIAFSGTADMLVEDGDVWSNGAAAVSGGADVALQGTLASNENCGGVAVSNNSTFNSQGTPLHLNPMRDPLDGLLNPAFVSGDNRVGSYYYPGSYGNETITGSARFLPGVYEFRNLTINGNVFAIASAGDDVPDADSPSRPWGPVFIKCRNFSIQSGSKVRLEAGQGNFNSVLVWATADVSVAGNSDVQLIGTIYAPNGAVNLTGTAEVPMVQGQVIGQTISVGGTNHAVVRWDPNYRAAPAVARLVE